MERKPGSQTYLDDVNHDTIEIEQIIIVYINNIKSFNKKNRVEFFILYTLFFLLLLYNIKDCFSLKFIVYFS